MGFDFELCSPMFISLFWLSFLLSYEISSLFPLKYFSPYVSADLHKMANAFNTSVALLEDELTQLILDGQISARIDSQKKVNIVCIL